MSPFSLLVTFSLIYLQYSSSRKSLHVYLSQCRFKVDVFGSLWQELCGNQDLITIQNKSDGPPTCLSYILRYTYLSHLLKTRASRDNFLERGILTVSMLRAAVGNRIDPHGLTSFLKTFIKRFHNCTEYLGNLAKWDETRWVFTDNWKRLY